jgi:hypothetical protein
VESLGLSSDKISNIIRNGTKLKIVIISKVTVKQLPYPNIAATESLLQNRTLNMMPKYKSSLPVARKSESQETDTGTMLTKQNNI